MQDDSNRADTPQSFDSLVIPAERMLSEVFGHPLRFTSVERLSEPERRNLILRCLSSTAGDLPSAFIIKKVEAEAYHPDDPDSWDTQRFFNDWAGNQFLSALGSGKDYGPRFYGGHRGLGFVILEDLGPHRSLVEPLLQEDAASARESLSRYIACLGRMHADTIGRFDAYRQLFQSVNPTGKSYARKASDLEQEIGQVLARLEALSVMPKADLRDELTDIVKAVVDPGPFLAYIHGDPCPDNVFDMLDGMRLIDFEFGYFGHALVDAAYARMIFPTCWCANRLPPAVITEMETLYRRELSKGCPEAEDDRVFELALVTISGFWLLDTLEWHLERALEGDRDWGIASVRQRILARLEAFVTTAKDFNKLPALRGAAGRLLDLLGKRWAECPPLPLYPAFREEEPGR